MIQEYRTLHIGRHDERVVTVAIDAPPMNLIGPELVRDLVGLVSALESDPETRVMVLEGADPEFFVPHVDLTKVAEYTAEAAKAGGPDDASLGMLWRKLSELPVVTIAKLRGSARGAGSELALACDMCFAARENTVLGQAELGFGAPPGAGGVQHLARLLGRGRAMEALLGAADFDADESIGLLASSTRWHQFSCLSPDAFRFDALEYTHLCHMVSVFFGGFPGVADDDEVQRDEHADGRRNRSDRLEYLKPRWRLACNL